MNDILKRIYSDYLYLKKENDPDNKILLLNLITAYYHLDDEEMVEKLMKEGELDYITATDLKGNVIPKIETMGWKEEKNR